MHFYQPLSDFFRLRGSSLLLGPGGGGADVGSMCPICSTCSGNNVSCAKNTE